MGRLRVYDTRLAWLSVYMLAPEKGENFWRDSQFACALRVKPIHAMKTRTSLLLQPTYSISASRRGLLLGVALALISLLPASTAPAVNPPPDGGYPNDNTAEGTGALSFLTTGSANTAVGSSALQNITTASRNTAIGAFALIGPNNANGSDNTATGCNALSANAASDNTATGSGALQNNSTGFNNTATGSGALQNNTTAPS